MTGTQTLSVRTSSPEDTEALGRRLGALLRAGDVVALTGDLGAGKTVLARGIAQGAGAAGHIASPTFTIIRSYPGPVTVHHVDLYRIEAPGQLEDLGWEDVLAGDGIVVIEWAEKAQALLAPEYLWIEIRFTEHDEVRDLTFSPHGRRAAEILRLLEAAGRS